METFEKKYKEALNWMQKIYPTLTGANKEDAEHYFPELKDSEDEKIRKEIIEYLTVTCEKDLVGHPERQRWIAYLKEQKSVQSDTEKQYVSTLESLISDFLHGKQEVDRDYYQQICDWLEVRHIEEKPVEWSEEDENRFNNLIFLVEYSGEGQATKEGFIKFIKRLKSLRPQPHWKPSKEQLNALHAFVGMIHPDARYDAVYSLLDELKAL